MAFQGDSIYWVETEKVVPNPFQPRREFDEHKLKELSESIRMYGVLQPLTVTRHEIQRDDGTFYTEYELIAGERRLRASRLAGVAQVPVIIREGEESEQEKLELAIIENLQREDLNAVDRALAFKQLADQFGLSHVQVAQKVGRSREYVSNSIRLLALPENILDALKRGEISEGHARTLLMLGDRPEQQQVVFEEAKLKKLSVRDVERIARGIATEKVRKKDSEYFDVELLEIEKQFTEALGTRVQIQKTEFGGRLAIDYFTPEDLTQILGKLSAEEGGGSAAASQMDAITEHTPLTVVEQPQEQAPLTEIPGVQSQSENVLQAATETNPPEQAVEKTEPPVSFEEKDEAELSHMRKILAGLTANLSGSIEDQVDAVEPIRTPEPTTEVQSSTPYSQPINENPVATADENVTIDSQKESESENGDEEETDLYSINRFTV